MIYDQLVTLDALLRDQELGLAAEVARVAAEKSVIVPAPVEISTWRIKWPGEFSAYPSTQQFWMSTPRLESVNQGRREGDFVFQWVTWFQLGALDTHLHIAIYADAFARIIDRIPGRGTIANVRDVEIGMTGLRETDWQYAGLGVQFTTTEIDATP